MGLRVISKPAPRQAMGTGQSQREIAGRPQSIEHGAKCESAGRIIDWQVRDGVRRMVAIIEEAGGSLAGQDLERRMGETGKNRHFDHIHFRASREGLVYMDDLGVFHVPQKRPVSTPEGRARLDVYLKALKLGIVRWTGGKRSVVAGDSCPLTRKEIETVKRFIIEGDAIAGSAEVSKMNRLCLEGKVTEAELDACRRKVAQQATEPQLQEQRRPQARKVRR